jgi:HAD superfamily hydrolase (TIGR01509 family)
MKRNNNVELVIFDMDGLMLDTERIYFRLWKRTSKEYGYDIKDLHLLKTMGSNNNDSAEFFKNHFGRNFPYCEMMETKERHMTEYIEKNGVPVKDGLYQLLDYLEHKKIFKAVATSTIREKALTLLKIAGIENRFDYIVCGDEVSNGKPDPDIFTCIADRANIGRSKCIVLEDSENGILAAIRAEMKPVFIEDIRKLPQHLKELVFAEFCSLTEFKDYLGTII